MSKVEVAEQLNMEKPQGDKKKSNDEPPFYKRQDIWAWFAGIVFIVTLSAMTFIVGDARAWDADSGFTHNTSATSKDRFWSEPDEQDPTIRGRSGVDATGRWYYWKIPQDQVTFWTHFFPWIGYVSHQILIWATIYYAQMKKAYEPPGKSRYSTTLSGVNWAAFGLNAFFHLLHFINTHTTYDATAQDVSISTSQSSVIMLLVLVMLLEYRERGVFFGWPVMTSTSKVSQKLRLNYGPINLVRKYHGYACAWAAIYTFWYHPMESTWGHVMGFFYTWIIMLQGSFMFNEIHLNKYWRLFIEMFVIIHGGVVASQTGGPSQLGTKLWPMFTFGFSLCFVLTQLFSLPFWKYIPKLCRVIPLLIYTGVALWAYSWIPDANGRTWIRLNEIIRIPSTYYGYFIFGWALLYGFMALEKKIGIEKPKNPSLGTSVFYLSLTLLIYAIHIGLGVAIEYGDVKMGLILLMVMFVGIYMVGACAAMMFLKNAIPNHISGEKDPIDYVNLEDQGTEGKTISVQSNGHIANETKSNGVSNGMANKNFTSNEDDQSVHL